MRWDELEPPEKESFDPLRPAEVALLRALRGEEGGAEIEDDGFICISEKPVDALGEAESLRAGFLRHLLLTGDPRAPLPERGLVIAGARIDGALDLEGAELGCDLGLARCAFDTAPVLRGARCRSLYFNGATMPGLEADSLRCAGDLFLSGGFKASGEVRFLGAEIGGDLDCKGATFDGGGGYALSADRVRVTGNVVLNSGFAAKGMVRLPGAKIDGTLHCTGAMLDGGEGYALTADRMRVAGSVFLHGGFAAKGEVRLLGVVIDSDLTCTGAMLDGGKGYALSADGVRVAGSVSLNGGFAAKGLVRLPGAEIGRNLDFVSATLDGGGGNALIVDDALVTGNVILLGGFKAKGALCFTAARLGAFVDQGACEIAPVLAPLHLTGCSYGAIHCKDGSFTADARIRWLDRCATSRPGTDFHPQPFEQLAKVFRESGHPEDARDILIEKERRLRKSRRMRLLDGHPLRARTSAVWDAMLDQTIRFGHRSLRAIFWLTGFWAVGAALFYAASQHDAIKPNQPVAMRAPEWVACAVPLGAKVHLRAPLPDGSTTLNGRADHNQSQRDCYEAQPEAAAWPEFNALVYSADTLLPVVSLEMQSYWIPDEDKNGAHWWSSLGWWARTYLWLHIAAGWALSLLAVAGFSGIVKSD